MGAFFLILLLVFNFAICWWDAYVAGKMWVESKAIGGWIRAVCWAAAVMSASGFTMIFMTILAFIAYGLHIIPMRGLEFMMNLDYVLVIFPILGAGAIITIHSWIMWWREGGLLNLGVASYNTFAMAYDTYNAVEGFGAAFKVVWDTLKDVGDDDSPWIGWCLVLAALAAGLGIMLTVSIIKHNAATLSLPQRATATAR